MKLRNKISLSNTFITLIILFISCIIILKAVDNFNLFTVYKSLLGQSEFSQQYLSEYFRYRENPAAALELEIKTLEDKLEKQTGCTVTVTGANPETPSQLQQIALQGKSSYLISTQGANRQLSISTPIFVKNRLIGTIVYEYSLYSVDNMKMSLQLLMLAIFAAVAIFSLLLNFYFSYRVIKPLEKLTEATKEFSKGNFRKILGINTGDEIETLAISFNQMGQGIMENLEKLKLEQDKQKKFLDNVTHEIRTPLTNILGYTDLLDRVSDETQKKKYISYISNEGNRLLLMVNNLLELSQLNRYEPSVQKSETDLPGLLSEVAGLMADRAKKFGFGIINNVDYANVHANIDREKIKQVIINLIDNAIKYSEGNVIEMKLSIDKMININVTDNGIGIPEEDIKYITEPFYRVDKSRSRKLGGNGLGLSICNDIIKAHGGTMRIESREGHGTAVTISLQP